MTNYKAFSGKAATRSMGVLGGAASILIVLASVIFDVTITPAETQEISGNVGEVIVKLGLIASGVASIYGRLRASERVTRLFN